ncbi:MAG: hypothetical protein GYA02_03050 [Clostridiaceae bacterium]|nr:hypothetical protein [Clostridiaceae bacterium]
MESIVRLLANILIYVLVITGIFTGCGKNDLVATSDSSNTTVWEESANNNKGSNIKEPITIRFYTTSSTDKTEFDYAIGEWNKKNPNIKVDVQ